MLRLLARLPALNRGRRMANKAIMFIMQMHMLHRMFVAEPRWRKKLEEAPAERPGATPDIALVA
jgi:hypothetical protein